MKPMLNCIDVHHHILPNFYFKLLNEFGVAESFLPNVDPVEWSIQGTLEMMERFGLRGVIANLYPGVPKLPKWQSACFARRANDGLASLIDDNPGALGAFAVLPLPHIEASLIEMSRAARELRLDGIGLLTNHSGVYAADRSHDPIFEFAESLNLPIFIHPTTPPSVGQPDFGLPPSLFEFTFETVRVAAQFLYNETFSRFPQLRVILCHGGGALPALHSRLESAPEIAVHLKDRLSQPPDETWRRFYFETAMTSGDGQLAALERFAKPSQILFGSDFPLMSMEYTERILHTLRSEHNIMSDDAFDNQVLNAKELFPRFKSG